LKAGLVIMLGLAGLSLVAGTVQAETKAQDTSARLSQLAFAVQNVEPDKLCGAIKPTTPVAFIMQKGEAGEKTTFRGEGCSAAMKALMTVVNAVGAPKYERNDNISTAGMMMRYSLNDPKDEFTLGVTFGPDAEIGDLIFTLVDR